MHQARKRNHFADVLQPADPRHGALEAQAKAGVCKRAAPAEVEIPAVRIEGQPFLVDPVEQLVVIVLAL